MARALHRIAAKSRSGRFDPRDEKSAELYFLCGNLGDHWEAVLNFEPLDFAVA